MALSLTQSRVVIPLHDGDKSQVPYTITQRYQSLNECWTIVKLHCRPTLSRPTCRCHLSSAGTGRRIERRARRKRTYLLSVLELSLLSRLSLGVALEWTSNTFQTRQHSSNSSATLANLPRRPLLYRAYASHRSNPSQLATSFLARTFLPTSQLFHFVA